MRATFYTQNGSRTMKCGIICGVVLVCTGCLHFKVLQKKKKLSSLNSGVGMAAQIVI